MFSTSEVLSVSNRSTCTARRNHQYWHLRKDRTYKFALPILVKYKQISFCEVMKFHKLSCKSKAKPSSVSHNHLAFWCLKCSLLQVSTELFVMLFWILTCRFISQFYFSFIPNKECQWTHTTGHKKINKWVGKLNRNKKLTCILQQVHPALVIGPEPTIIQHSNTLSLPCNHFSNALITHLHGWVFFLQKQKEKRECERAR
jgi:hypothetical protein